MADSMCRELGIGVDHVVVVDFRGLIDAVDTIGGVRVSTATPVRDQRAGLSLPASGDHRLDGAGALAWVRSRHAEVWERGEWKADTTADPSRATHALQVLEQIATTTDDPLTLQRAVWSAGPHVRRSGDLGLWGMVDLARDLRAVVKADRVDSAPARATGTEVPFAFPTEATVRALAPYTTPHCAQR